MPSQRHVVDRRQRVADMFDITQVVVIVAGFALLATLVFFLKGLYLIRAGEVGVLVKRLGGRKMPAGQSIAPHGGGGGQAGALIARPYWRGSPGGGERPAQGGPGGPAGKATREGMEGRPVSRR